MSTPELTEEIARLLDGITQGEAWTACHDEDGVPLVCLRHDKQHDGPVIWQDGMGQAMTLTHEDAEFIAAAPRLLRAAKAEIRRQQEETERLKGEGVAKSGAACAKHGDPLVCLACEAEEDARPEWQKPHRVTPPRLRGEPPRESHRCSGCGHRWEDRPAGQGEWTVAELCGDCWRKAQPVLHGVSEVN